MKKYDRPFIEHIYADYQKSRSFSAGTISKSRLHIKYFYEYLHTVNKEDLRDVTKEDALGFYHFIDSYVGKRTGKKLSKGFKESILTGISVLFGYLFKNGYLLFNGFEGFHFEYRGVEKVRHVFSVEDVNLFLDSIEVESFTGARDRAVFELIYGSGLRRSEAVHLKMDDLKLKHREVLVRCGKFKKDRLAPLTKVSEKFLKLYLKRLWGMKRSHPYLFISREGKKLNGSMLAHYFRKYIAACGLEEKGYTVHSLRHAAATHLLEQGAGLRYVCELLGHEKLSTTVRYTHLMIDSLKRVYKSYHPRENEYYREIGSDYWNKVNEMKKRFEQYRSKTEKVKKS